MCAASYKGFRFALQLGDILCYRAIEGLLDDRLLADEFVLLPTIFATWMVPS